MVCFRDVACEAGPVFVDQRAPGPNDEQAAEFGGIALHAALAKTAQPRTCGSGQGSRIENPGDPSTQCETSMDLEGGIGEDRRGQSCVFGEPTRLFGGSAPDPDQLRAGFVNLLDLVAQLLDLLAAQQSAEVPHECEDDRPVAPETS